MSEIHHSLNSEKRLEGSIFRPKTPMELARVIDLAFDYRGDVTIELKSGECVTGYVVDRKATQLEPCIELLSVDNPNKKTIEYFEIAAISFSGEDTAFGKSWEAWIKKKEEDNKDN